MISLQRVGREAVLWTGGALGTLCLAGFLAGWLLHVTPLVFVSGSMSPTYEAGAVGIAREVPASRLEVGDVVSVVNAAGNRVTHRVVATTPSDAGVALTLKGDTNNLPDDETYDVATADRVVFGVPYVGYVLNAATTPFGLLVMALIAFGSVALGFGRRDGDAPRHGRTRLLLPTGVASLVALGGVVGVSGGAPWAFTSAVWTDSATATSSIGAVATDTTPPVLSDPRPSGGASASTWSGIDCADSGSGVSQLCVTATDAGGSGIASVSVKLVRTSSNECWNGTAWVSGTGCAAQTMTVLTGNQYRTSGLTAALMSTGTYRATYVASDGAANPATPLTVDFAVQPAPTMTSCVGNGNGSTNGFTIGWSWSGTATTSFKVYFNSSPTRSAVTVTASGPSYSYTTVGINAENGTFQVAAIIDGIESPKSNGWNYTAQGGKSCTVVP